jgi:hypothetical protein
MRRTRDWHRAAGLSLARKVEADINERLGWDAPALLFVVFLNPHKGLEAIPIRSFTEAALRGGDPAAMLQSLSQGATNFPRPVEGEIWGWLLVLETINPELRLVTVCNPTAGLILVSRDRENNEVRETFETVSGPTPEALRALTAATVRTAADYVGLN